MIIWPKPFLSVMVHYLKAPRLCWKRSALVLPSIDDRKLNNNRWRNEVHRSDTSFFLKRIHNNRALLQCRKLESWKRRGEYITDWRVITPILSIRKDQRNVNALYYKSYQAACDGKRNGLRWRYVHSDGYFCGIKVDTARVEAFEKPTVFFSGSIANFKVSESHSVNGASSWMCLLPNPS